MAAGTREGPMKAAPVQKNRFLCDLVSHRKRCDTRPAVVNVPRAQCVDRLLQLDVHTGPVPEMGELGFGA